MRSTYSRRLFLSSLPVLRAWGASDNVFPSEAKRYPDGATEFEVVRLTDPAHTCRLPAYYSHAVSRRGNFLLYTSDRGGPVQAPWDANPLLWELLWELAGRARRSQAVDRFCLSNPEPGRAIVDRRSRLGRLLPPGLDGLIRAAGRRAYRLQLPPGEVALFHVDRRFWFQ